MRLIRSLAIIVALAGAPIAPTAHAQCAGFTDVANDVFCNSVAWIKNRQITLGCSSATLFCPHDSVSRLAMAAFMNRLGNVLTPLVLAEEETGASLDLVNGAFFVCQSDVVPATNYPRTMHAQASISFALADVQTVAYGISASENGGVFGFDFPLMATNGPGLHQLHYLSERRPVLAGSTYRFAIRIARFGSQPVPLTGWGCHLQVTILHAASTQ